MITAMWRDTRRMPRHRHTLHTVLGVGALGGVALLLVFLPVRPLIGLIGALAAAVIVIAQPWLVWVGLGILLPVTSGVKVGPLSLSDLILAGGVAMWFADGVRRRRLWLAPHPLLWTLLGYIGVLYLSLLQATDVREAVAEVLKWVQFGLVLTLVPTMLPRRQSHWLIIGLLLGGALQGLLGVYQFVFRIGPEWFIILGRFMRASGTFNQPNPYAGYLGLTLPVAVSLSLWGLNHLRSKWGSAQPGTRTEHSPAAARQPIAHSIHLPNQLQGEQIDSKRTALSSLFSVIVYPLIYLGAAAAIGTGLLASWSRGGWLGAAAALAVVMAIRSRQAAVVSSIAALAVGGALLIGAFGGSWLPEPVADRFADVPAYFGLTDVLNEPLTDENFAIVERIAHWVAAVRMWDRAPWLGVGPGNYAVVYPEVRLPLWEEPLGHAHNIYLNLLAESGMLGLLAYLIFWSTVLGWLWRRWRSTSNRAVPAATWQAPFIIGVIGVVVHLSIHNFFDNLFVQGNYLHIALWLAVVYRLSLPEHLLQDFAIDKRG